MPLPELRIVSLIASATEIVFELGLGEFLVGRSHECDYPPQVEALPVCTRARVDPAADSRTIDNQVKEQLRSAVSVYEVLDDVLERLQPTHILTQTQCEVCAVSLRDVERSVAMRLASRPRIVSLAPNCLQDIWLDMAAVASACELDPGPVVARLRGRMEALQSAVSAGKTRPRVACIEWLEPLMAAGNWVPELVALAGAQNIFGRPGLHSPWMQWEDLIREDPDFILLMPCGFSLDRVAGEMYWLTDRPAWSSLSAVKNRQVYLTDGNRYFNRPGPGLVESLQILAEILHPSLVPPQLAGLAYQCLPEPSV